MPPRSRASVTLFNAEVFYQGKCKTYLVCSDTKDKEKNAVFTFVTKLYDQIMIEVSPQVNDVIYSDGPSSEFKNKYTMKLLAQKVNGTVSWNLCHITKVNCQAEGYEQKKTM